MILLSSAEPIVTPPAHLTPDSYVTLCRTYETFVGNGDKCSSKGVCSNILGNDFYSCALRLPLLKYAKENSEVTSKFSTFDKTPQLQVYWQKGSRQQRLGMGVVLDVDATHCFVGFIAPHIVLMQHPIYDGQNEMARLWHYFLACKLV